MTLLRRSFLVPGSWSAAIIKNFSVLVADGRTTGTVSSLTGAAAGCETSVTVTSGFVYCSIFEVGEGSVGWGGEGKGWAGADMRAGATVVGGGLKKERSSRDSKKSDSTENSLPSVSGG